MNQNTAMTAPVVTNASTSSCGADVGRCTTKVRGQIATTKANRINGSPERT